MKYRLYRLRLQLTFPWLLAIVRREWADFGRAAELAKARGRGR
jgi:hypothetical protein